MTTVTAQEVSAEIREIIARSKVALPFHRTWISLSQYQKSYDLAQRYLRPGAVVLDWGAGNGHFGLFLLKCGFLPHAFSLREFPAYRAFIEAINEKYNGRYKSLVGDPAINKITIPYANNSFDGVFSIGVLEHVREFDGDEIGSLEEIHRILKPNGVFICTKFPNRWSYVEQIKGRHKFKYTLSDIRVMAQKTGFDVQELGRYQFLPRVMLNKLPESVANSALATGLYNALDSLLTFTFNPFCTCNYFVFRKLPDELPASSA